MAAIKQLGVSSLEVRPSKIAKVLGEQVASPRS